MIKESVVGIVVVYEGRVAEQRALIRGDRLPPGWNVGTVALAVWHLTVLFLIILIIFIIFIWNLAFGIWHHFEYEFEFEFEFGIWMGFMGILGKGSAES